MHVAFIIEFLREFFKYYIHDVFIFVQFRCEHDCFSDQIFFFFRFQIKHHCENERHFIAKMKSDDEKITIKKRINYKKLKWISLKKALDENWSYVQYVQYVQWILLMYFTTFHDFMQLYAIFCDVLSSFIIRCKARLFAIKRKESLLFRMINHVY